MNSLYFSTSGDYSSVAIFKDKVFIDQVFASSKHKTSEELPLLVNQILKKQELLLTEIDLFGIENGPGSFTGIRAGMAYLMGITLFSHAKIAMISFLEAMIFSKKAPQQDRKAILWARENEFFSLDIKNNILAEEKTEIINEFNKDTAYILNDSSRFSIVDSNIKTISVNAELVGEVIISNLEKYIINREDFLPNYIKEAYVT